MNSKLQQLKDHCSERAILKRTVKSDVDALQVKVDDAVHNDEVMRKAILLLGTVSDNARGSVKSSFEKIVTEALQFITQSTDYEFVIQENKNGSKPAYEFYIKTTVDGVESLQNPIEANGGGFIDIISVAAKYAYLELFNAPRIMNSSVILDEPGKMIDEQRSIKFAEYLKELGSSYNKQTIMITHNPTLTTIADKTYYVTQTADKVSHVSDMSTIPLNMIQQSVDNQLGEKEVDNQLGEKEKDGK